MADLITALTVFSLGGLSLWLLLYTRPNTAMQVSQASAVDRTGRFVWGASLAMARRRPFRQLVHLVTGIELGLPPRWTGIGLALSRSVIRA